MSDAVRAELQLVEMMANLEVLQEITGTQINYYHEQPIDSTDYVTIWVCPDSKRNTTENRFGTQRVEAHEAVFFTVRQENDSGVFPPVDGITIGDRLVDPTDGRNRWMVQDWESSKYDSKYWLRCVKVTDKSTLPHVA